MPQGLDVRVITDPDISGTAGMLRLAVDRHAEGPIVIMPVNMVDPPAVTTLLELHKAGGADLTLFADPSSRNDLPEIYVCNSQLLCHIPTGGYWDIKERLVPELAVLGRPVRQVSLPRSPGCFYDGHSYLNAICLHLEDIAGHDPSIRLARSDQQSRIWAADDVDVEDQARIYGPVAIFEQARIGRAVVVGPTIVGPGARIDDDAIVVGSVIWPGAQVSAGSSIDHCLVATGVSAGRKMVADRQVITNSTRPARVAPAGSIRMPRPMPQQRMASGILMAAICGAAILWSFWPQWQDLWAIWQRSDEYSAGMLVPGLAAYVLWCRRSQLKDIAIQPSAWGMVLLILSQVIRFYGLYHMRSFVERSSVVLGIMGVVLWLAGKGLFGRVLTVLLFLFLMLPLPQGLHSRIALPLQGWSTASAVFGLELLGYDVVREGNVIQIGQTSVAVAEACNGLRMITAFVIISGMLALLVNRNWWEKLIMLVSSLPIALVCNTTRLIVTAIAFTLITGPGWEKAFHDLGGYAMMPLAVAILLAELWVMRLLTTAPTKGQASDIIVRPIKKDGA